MPVTSSIRRTDGPLTAKRISVPLAPARWNAWSRLFSPAESQNAVVVRSTMSVAGPSRMTESRHARTSPALRASICAGAETTAARSIHSTG
jgi:hypothetical protein